MKPVVLFLLAAACFSSIIASPTSGGYCNDRKHRFCLTDTSATKIVNEFISILEHTNTNEARVKAENLLADSFQEVSQSIQSLQELPLDATTFPSKQKYIDGVLSAPGITGVTTHNIAVVNCNKVMWFWTFTSLGNKQYPVRGFNLFTVDETAIFPTNVDELHKITRVDLEFNSIAWGENTGGTYTPRAQQNTTKNGEDGKSTQQDFSSRSLSMLAFTPISPASTITSSEESSLTVRDPTTDAVQIVCSGSDLKHKDHLTTCKDPKSVDLSANDCKDMCACLGNSMICINNYRDCEKYNMADFCYAKHDKWSCHCPTKDNKASTLAAEESVPVPAPAPAPAPVSKPQNLSTHPNNSLAQRTNDLGLFCEGKLDDPEYVSACLNLEFLYMSANDCMGKCGCTGDGMSCTTPNADCATDEEVTKYCQERHDPFSCRC